MVHLPVLEELTSTWKQILNLLHQASSRTAVSFETIMVGQKFHLLHIGTERLHRRLTSTSWPPKLPAIADVW
jgi:hypothetical protein